MIELYSEFRPKDELTMLDCDRVGDRIKMTRQEGKKAECQSDLQSKKNKNILHIKLNLKFLSWKL